MSESPDPPDFDGDDNDEEEAETEVATEEEEEQQVDTSGLGLDEQHQEYLDELVEQGRYDSEQEAIEFAIRYSASEKYGV